MFKKINLSYLIYRGIFGFSLAPGALFLLIGLALIIDGPTGILGANYQDALYEGRLLSSSDIQGLKNVGNSIVYLLYICTAMSVAFTADALRSQLKAKTNK